MTDFDKEIQNTKRNDGDYPYGKENVIFLLEWIHGRTVDKKFGINWLYQSADPGTEISRSAFYNLIENRKKEDEWKKLPEVLFYKIVRILKVNHNFFAHNDMANIAAAGDDHLYFSVSEKLGMWSTTVREMSEALPGFYTSYRPSLLLPGAVVRGLVRFTYDPEKNTFRTWELHAYRHNGNPKDSKAIFSSQIRQQTFSGYVWRREFRYLWIDQDVGTGVFRNNILHRYYAENKKVIALNGLTSGHWAGKIYSAKVYLERISEDCDLEALSKSERTKYLFAGLRRVSIIPSDRLDKEVPEIALSLIDPRRKKSLVTI